jgi:hypothetical protein
MRNTVKDIQKSIQVKKLVYIMSPSYSGSTLLTFLLANHPDVATIGELKASALGDIKQYNCSCGELITECGFWARVESEMKALGHSFELNHFGTHFRVSDPLQDRILRALVRGPLFEHIRDLACTLTPGCRRTLKSIILQNKAMIDVIMSIQKAKVFLDGSKDPIRLRHFLDSNNWDIRLIALYRDGRGVANSYMNHVGVSMEVAANEWLLKCKEMQNVLRRISKENVYSCRYETLCQETPRILDNIIQFIGLDSGNLPEDYGVTVHHILGNAMRLKGSNEVKLDEKWKRMLSREDLNTFYKIGGSMNAELGYTR